MTSTMITTSLMTGIVGGLIVYVVLAGTHWGREIVRAYSYTTKHRAVVDWGFEGADQMSLRLRVERIRTEPLSADTRELRRIP